VILEVSSDAITSDGVVVGASRDGAGEDGQRVVEGHGGGDADADGVAGAAVDAEDDAAHARALALLRVPHVPPRVPLHPQLTTSLPRTLEGEGPPEGGGGG
jgi:hypothetical protein